MRLGANYIALAAVTVFVAVGLPWMFYGYSLSFVEGRPTTPSARMSSEDVGQVWSSQERTLRQDDLAAISPYWFYKWSWCAFELTNCSDASRGMSNMASFVALWYLRDGHFNGNGLAWWHAAHASLTIWIQRNMTPEDLVASYAETQRRITSHSSGRASPAAERGR